MSSRYYKFVQTDGKEVLNELVSKYEELTGHTLLPADPDKLFISWVADVIAQERALINYAANQNIPSRASGENLDALGEFLYGVARPQAKAARCTMRFEISAPQNTSVAIPKGTRISDASKALVWETERDEVIPIGSTEAEVSAVCQTLGTAGNGYTPGQINLLIDVDDILFFKSCANTDISSGGSEQATDAEYYEIMRQSLERFSAAGSKGAYEYYAKTVSLDIADVCAVTPESKPGYVDIYAVMKDGSIADEGTKAAIAEACGSEKVRPLTDVVEVLDPEETEFNIDLTYYVDKASEKSLGDIAAAVENAVSEYIRWQRGKIGRDINPSQLMWLLRDTGVKRIDVKEPVYTVLRDGSSRNAPQIAKLGSVKTANGGYEDE